MSTSGPSRRDGSPQRIVILTARVGHGHLAAAGTLAAELREADPDVEALVVDVLELWGGTLQLLLLDGYRLQLRRAPWMFGVLFFLFLRLRAARSAGRAALSLLGGRRLRRALRELRPDLVVSTYPAATSVLGSLRRRGHIDVPTCATITDLAGAAFWSHPGIDLHLVMHPSLVRAVEREAGPNSVRVARPLVAAPFFEHRSRVDARRRLDLPAAGRVVLVSGGGWGVGDLAGAVAESLALPDTTVVCLAGRDTSLRDELARRFAGDPRVLVLGFTDRMPELLAAADVLVHSTGGVTCLEAIVSGCPIVAFGAPAGHAPLLARAMAAAGVAAYARSRQELRRALPVAVPASPLPPAATAAGLVLTARLRTARRPRAGRVAAGIALAAGAAFFAASSKHAFALVAGDLDLTPPAVLTTATPRVGLVVETSPSSAARLARLVASAGATATFAFRRPPGASIVRSLAAHGDDVVPALSPAGLDDWLDTADVVRDVRLRLHGSRSFVLAPPTGLSGGQYLLARLAGARPVAAALSIDAARASPPRLRRGAIVVVTVGSGPAGRHALTAVLEAAARARLRPGTLARLANA